MGRSAKTTSKTAESSKATPRKRRRQVWDIVTQDTIAAQGRKLWQELRSFETMLAPPCTDDEEKQREVIVEKAALHAAFAALAYVQERDRAAYKCILNGAFRFVEEYVVNGSARFVVLPQKRDLSLWSRVRMQATLAVYETLKAKLQPQWRHRPVVSTASVNADSAGRTHRYGEAQAIGLSRRRSILAFRVKAVHDALTALYAQMKDASDLPAIDEKSIARWVRNHMALRAVCEEAVAHVLKETPRLVRKQLNLARKQAKQSTADVANLKLRQHES